MGTGRGLRRNRIHATGKAVKYRKYLVSAAVVVAAVAAVGWWLYCQVPQITAVSPRRGTAVEIVYATGAVEPVRWAKVASLVRDRIVETCDCEGEAVAEGDVLARLADREVRAQLQELKAREEFLRQEMRRVSELIARNAATAQAFERTSADLRQVEALISVQIARIDDYIITAPMNGVVLRSDAQVGEIAEAGQILFRVGEPKPLQVVAEVNEEDIPRVKLGQKTLLRTDAFPDRRLEGTVSEITPMGDAVAKTYRIKIALPNDSPLQPGMSVEANVITREKDNALLIPADAIRDQSVFVIEGGRVRERKVKLGIRGTRAVEILDGLNEGQRIASPAATELTDGKRVREVKAPGAEE